MSLLDTIKRGTASPVALITFVLLAYLLGSRLDESVAAKAERAEANRIAAAYRQGVTDGEENERFRRALIETSHE